MTFAYVSPSVLRARHQKPPLAQEASPTSVLAARSIEALRMTLRERVFWAIAGGGEAGATAQEVEDATGLAGSTVRPRIVELFEAQRIQRTTRTRPTRSRRQATVWIVS